MNVQPTEEPEEIEKDKEKEEEGSFGQTLGGLVVIGVIVFFALRGGRTLLNRYFPSVFPPPVVTPAPTPTLKQWQTLQASSHQIPYATLFRYAEQHEGKQVYYRGKVIQVIEQNGNYQLRVNVTSDNNGWWSDTVLLRYWGAPVRILEDDIVAFVGTMNGTVTYESVLGGEITIPYISVVALKIERGRE